jgi:hypothetical protein
MGYSSGSGHELGERSICGNGRLKMLLDTDGEQPDTLSATIGKLVASI